jgi:hypothetical protein
MAKAKQATPLKWYQERRWAAVLVPVCLLGCYIMASLAINSGALLQYFVAILFLILAINRLAHVIIVTVTGRPHNG